MTVAGAPVHHDLEHVTPEDLRLFREGTHFRLHEKLGAHLVRRGDGEGVHFAVWAPGASSVSVMSSKSGSILGRSDSASSSFASRPS